MDRVLRSLALVTALALLGAPATAWARKHIVAPGDPGSAQYQEDVPTAGGSRPVSTIGGAPRRSVIPQTVARQLHRDGSAGRQVSALTQATAPPQPSRLTRERILQYRSVGAITLLSQAVFTGDLLPMLLGLSIFVVIMVTVRRRGS